MARLLILSSQVAAGHVGLSAAGPACLALGHAVTGLPTVLLSHHPGFAHAAGTAVAPDTLSAMIDGLYRAGFLADHDAVLTGYLPSPAHVAIAVGLIDRLRKRAPGLRVVVDPVLGDAPKGLYLPEAVARALRDDLLPRADIATPNAFELGWLTGRGVDGIAAARDAARALPVPRILVTSAPAEAARQTALIDVTGAEARLYRMPLATDVPQGPGDVLAGLIAAGLSVPAALGHVQALIAASLGAPHLRLAGLPWRMAPPLCETGERV